MKTNVDLSTLSDGIIYQLFDLAPTDTDGCIDCSECCHGIGETAQLNPYDVYAIGKALNKSFDVLVTEHIEIRPYNRFRMPYLKMVGSDESCSFLSKSGRCEIHAHRPDVCRLFPLGRVYAEKDYAYFFQPNACVKSELLPIVVDQWIGIERYEENHDFLLVWRQVLKAFDFRLRFVYDPTEKNALVDFFLSAFYAEFLDSDDDFYGAFYKVLPNVKKKLGIL